MLDNPKRRRIIRLLRRQMMTDRLTRALRQLEEAQGLLAAAFVDSTDNSPYEQALLEARAALDETIALVEQSADYDR